MLLRVRRSLGPRAGSLACAGRYCVFGAVHHSSFRAQRGRSRTIERGANAQVVGQNESTIDALREAAPSASWCYVACERAVDSRCRIAESFDIVARAQARRLVPCVCNEQDDGAHATAAPSRNRCIVDADG